MRSGQSSETLKHRALHLLFPAQCLGCAARVQDDGCLCGECWRQTPFVLGLACDACGAPMIGDAADAPQTCDACRAARRPWVQGRAVMLYRDMARKLVLGLKHGDRLDLVPAMAGWMARSARPLLTDHTLVAPVPAHWTRMFRRRYNQAAVLGNALARNVGRPVCPDLLTRLRRTETQDGKSPEARTANLSGAIGVSPRHADRIAGRDVLIVDDVMTTGATFAACAQACLDAGAREVRVIALARVARDG